MKKGSVQKPFAECTDGLALNALLQAEDKQPHLQHIPFCETAELQKLLLQQSQPCTACATRAVILCRLTGHLVARTKYPKDQKQIAHEKNHLKG